LTHEESEAWPIVAKLAERWGWDSNPGQPGSQANTVLACFSKSQCQFPTSLPVAGKRMAWETSSFSGSEALRMKPPRACLRGSRLTPGPPPSRVTAGGPKASRNRALTLARTSSRSSSSPWQPCPPCGANSKSSSRCSWGTIAHLALPTGNPHSALCPFCPGLPRASPLSPPHPTTALFYPSHPVLPSPSHALQSELPLLMALRPISDADVCGPEPYLPLPPRMWGTGLGRVFTPSDLTHAYKHTTLSPYTCTLCSHPSTQHKGHIRWGQEPGSLGWPAS
jgi:hypothetical protein